MSEVSDPSHASDPSTVSDPSDPSDPFSTQRPSPMPFHRYRPYQEQFTVELPDRTWPTRHVDKAP